MNKIFEDNVKQWLIETMADFLDKIQFDEACANVYDPVKKEKIELHIRMAEAAFKEYKKTMRVKK